MTQTIDSTSFWHPSRPAYRYMILLYASMLTFGSYFAYDIIGAISSTLATDLHIPRKIISASYTWYSIAAIISVLFGGILIDRYGIRRSSLIFSSLVLGGSIIIVAAKSIPMLLAGRFIFGAGSETLIVAQMAMVARWFKGKEIAMAFGVTLTVSRLGTFFSLNTGELITSYFGSYRYALFVAMLVCLLSFMANLLYNYFDRKAEKKLEFQKEGKSDKIVWKDLGRFKPSFWYVTLLCLTFYSAIFPFTALSPDFFVDKWGIPKVIEASGGFFSKLLNNVFHMFSTGGGITSIIITASMICAPFAGRLVDRIGRRGTLMIFGSLILIPSHLLLGVTRIYPAYPMITLGIAFVLVPAAMWPSIPLIVPKEKTGTAYGLMTMIQNGGLALFPLLNGWLRDITHTYTASMVMFSCLGIFGLVFALLLKRHDRMAGSLLEKP